MYYINYFFVFSFIGHILENFVYQNKDSGILYGIWTPIYGIGILIIFLIYNILNKFKLNKYLKPILLFLSCGLVLSIIEGISGYLIESIFHTIFWDYSKFNFNIGKYMALEIALIWGLSGVVFIYLIKPLFDKIISKIPKYLTYPLIILLVYDVILTLTIKH